MHEQQTAADCSNAVYDSDACARQHADGLGSSTLLPSAHVKSPLALAARGSFKLRDGGTAVLQWCKRPFS